MGCKVLPGPLLGHLEQHSARLPFAQMPLGSTSHQCASPVEPGFEGCTSRRHMSPVVLCVSHPTPPGGGFWSLWHLSMELERCPVVNIQPLEPLRSLHGPCSDTAFPPFPFILAPLASSDTHALVCRLGLSFSQAPLGKALRCLPARLPFLFVALVTLCLLSDPHVSRFTPALAHASTNTPVCPEL